MIEHGGPNGIKKATKLKPLASKVCFFEILMDFGKLVFFDVWRAGKNGPQNQTNHVLGQTKVEGQKSRHQRKG